MTPEEIMQLKDGDRIRVTWWGGNGPHEYVVRWRMWADTPIAVCLEPLADGSEFDVDPLLSTPTDKRCLHKVERL